jgi:hypothetical protein
MEQQIAGAVDQRGWRTIRHFAYVDRPFQDVRRAVTAAPDELVTGSAGPDAEHPEPQGELHVRRAGVDFVRDIRMVLGEAQVGVHSARLPIRWEDATRPGLFPILDATLEVAPVRAGRRAMTQLGLFGRYRPPFGRLGALADNLAGNAIVVESVDRFLDRLVDRFHGTIPARDPDGDTEGGTTVHEMPGRRRIVLPVDALHHSPGGAAGLAIRLLSEPGVLDASVNPRTGLAVVDYEAAACDLGRLVEILEAEE